MKFIAPLCTAILALGTKVVAAQSGLDPSMDPAAPTNTLPTTPQPSSSDSPSDKVLQPPRGDLVDLARHPVAELLLNVELRLTDPTVHYEIRSSASNAVLLTCRASCKFRIWPGRYRLTTRSEYGDIESQQSLLIDQDSRIDVQSAQSYRPLLGATLALAGAIAFGTGAIVFQKSDCDRRCSDGVAMRNRAGLGLMLGGIVAVPVGAVVLAFGLNPELNITPTNATRAMALNHAKGSTNGLSLSLVF